MLSRREILAAPLAAAARPKARPNIVLILADDLGYGDVGCFGSPAIRTPRLDRLAAEGARLTGHYVCSPVCSPSRAGLLTGRYPQRCGVTGVLRDPDDGRGMALSEVTLAEVLAGQGYDTALVGKWHLGMPPAYRPGRRGFRHFYGFLNGAIDYDTHLSAGGGWTGKRTTFRGDDPVEENGYYAELLHREAVRYIEQARRPFFLYFASPLPHQPLKVPAEWSAPYRSLGDPAKAAYAGMVACLDHGIGQVLDALDRTGAARDTIVIFLSDNGWTKIGRKAQEIGSNAPFRGGKYELTEGGVRSPALVRWPARIRPGTVLDHPVTSLDWFPTLAAAAGVTAPPRHALDGASLLSLLTAGRAPRERTLFWAFEDKLVGTPMSYAARRGPWKLLDVGGKRCLYDLSADPRESRDLAGQNAAVMRRLERDLAAWRRDTGA